MRKLRLSGIVTKTVSDKGRVLAQTWGQPQSEAFTDLLLCKLSSICSDESYGMNSGLIIPVLNTETPARKPWPPTSPGGICLFWRLVQKKNGQFYFGFSESWQVQLVPCKRGHCSQQAPKTEA